VHSRLSLALVASLLISSTILSQSNDETATDSARPAPPSSPPQNSAAPPSVSLSGVLFLNYQYGRPRNAASQNRFDLDRAYLTARAATGSRDSIRVTLDVFQQRDDSRDDYYTGWSMRVKYAYLNHDFVRGSGDDVRVFARLGLIQTVVIEQEERFWPRGLSSVAVDLNGYFNSADAGAAAGITLPNRIGEIYTTLVNGSGYTSRETDRYKDFQSRLTLTPWAKGTGPLRGLELTPWFSIGGRASDFLRGKGTVQPVSEARRKHRYGFLTTYRDARFTFGAQVARRLEVAESADTTRDTSPATRDVTGHLTSVFGFWRPLASASRTSPWSLLARVDDVQPDDITDASQRRYFVGTTWDLSSRTSVTFDVQSLFPKNGFSSVPTRTFFLHIISTF
jgi:hypothetical protein